MARATVLFLGKFGDTHCEKALEFLRQQSLEVTAHLSKWGDPFPKEALEQSYDLVISYLSRWIVPASVLDRARVAALNFHPAPPEYPGIGCNNFALYEGAKEYGATCHHMAPKVDTGAIVAVKRFPLYPSDTVASMLVRTYDFQLAMFYEVFAHFFATGAFPSSPERWTRVPFTRKQLNALSEITLDMDADEIARRVRATTFGPFKPWVKIHGHVFEFKE